MTPRVKLCRECGEIEPVHFVYCSRCGNLLVGVTVCETCCALCEDGVRCACEEGAE